jgi:hypothetical protein
MPASKPIPFEGVLNCWNDEHDLPDLLLAVSRSGKTGRLQFSNAEADKTLYLKDGKIVFAESASDDDGLGQYLMRIGKVSLEDYARVSKLVEPGKRLGALLVAEGVLEPKDLAPAVVGQVRAIILGLFRRTESWYGFKEEQLARKESITLDIPVAQLVLDGVQNVESWRRVSKGVGDIESVYQLVEAKSDEWSNLDLDPSLAELISMLEEPISVAQVSTKAHLPDFDACRYLWAFRSLGWVEPAVIKAVEPVREETDALADEELDDDALVAAAAASADSAEAPGPPPVRPTIPERWIQTQISAVRAKEPETPKAPQAPPPRAIPEDLTRTRVAFEPATASPETTSPDVTPKPAPRPIPDDLVHTRLDVQPKPDPPEEKEEPATLSTPSAAEMMESILEEGGSPQPSIPRRAPAPSSNAATQFFSGPSALEEPEPSPADDESDPFAAVSYEDFDAAPPDPTPPAPQPTPTSAPETPGPSFEDLALSDPAVPVASIDSNPVPVPASIPEPEPEPSLPVVEGDVVEPEPLPVEGGGMEFLMSNDALVIPEQNPIPPTAFSTQDPFRPEKFGEEPIAASLPKRPRTDEMDLDMDGLGHILRKND